MIDILNMASSIKPPFSISLVGLNGMSYAVFIQTEIANVHIKM